MLAAFVNTITRKQQIARPTGNLAEGLRGFITEWRSPIQPAVIDAQTFNILAVLFADDDVFALTVVI